MLKTINKQNIRKILFKILRYCGLPAFLRTFVQKNRITAIYYHDIDPISFETHIKYIRKHYNIISIKELSGFLQGTVKTLPSRSMLITFDDGHASNFNLLNLIKKYNFRPTVFLTTGMISSEKSFWFKLPFKNQGEKTMLKSIPDEDRREYLAKHYPEEKNRNVGQSLTWDEVIEMSDNFDFHSHTQNHPCLTKCNDEVAWAELYESKKTIEEKIKKPCYAVAFPNGDFTQRSIDQSYEIGYRLGFTGKHGYVSKNSKPFELPRLSMNDTKNIDDFVVRSSGLWFMLKKMFNTLKT